MATKDLKPRPTEYKGIVYRSKSEAMFAAWLETYIENGHLDGMTYEPECFRVGDWIPDFATWKVFFDDESPRISFRIIEYKPSCPTECYIGEFERNAYTVGRRFNSGTMSAMSFMIQYGSMWSDDRGWVEFQKTAEDDFGEFDLVRNDVVSDWIGGLDRDLLNIRFDLKK